MTQQPSDAQQKVWGVLRDPEIQKQLCAILVEQTPEAVCILSPDAQILYANPIAETVFSIGGILGDMVGPHQKEDVMMAVTDVAVQQPAPVARVSLQLPNGNYYQARFSRLQVENRIFVLCVATDVSGYHAGQQRLLESESRYRMIAENSMDIISENLLDGTTLYISPAALKVTGFTSEERLQKNTFDQVHPEDLPGIRAAVKTLIETGEARMTFRFRRKDGYYVYLESVGRHVQNPYVYEGRPFMVVVSRDVTERVSMMRELEASLKEKEILLREIHHRVKNNLQIISSLLSLQTQFLKDSDSEAIFQDCQSRIKSIALIHETLYQSRDLSQIDFSAYMASLAGRLEGSYLGRASHVRVDAPKRDVYLPIDLAISCGLIVNELITNALKYAFPDGRKGRVLVDIAYDAAEKQFCLQVSDNGVGIPPSVDLDSPTTLGLQLVMTLAQQLEAMIDIDNKAGTTVKLYFSVAEERSAG